MTEIQKELFLNEDKEYKDFTAKLIPNIDKQNIIGVRTPVLRKIARKHINNTEFLSSPNHKYYEENNIHGIIISQMNDYSVAVNHLCDFLPYVDNWATCDIISPKAFKKAPPELINQVKLWLNDKHTYTVRFAIGVLLKFYLDDSFDPEYLEIVSKIKTNEYYINMMIAWFFTESLVKQYDTAVKYLTKNRFDDFVHQKTIQKAVDSFRISDDKKSYLKSLRR